MPGLNLSTIAGLHIPEIPLRSVLGNTGTFPFAQMARAVPKLNTGVAFGVTVTVNSVGNAQRPSAGVKVYTPVAVGLTVAGLHVPVIPSIDVAGNTGAAPSSQIVWVKPKLNVGTTFGVTSTVSVAATAHCPAFGVNV
jgi:hypothetical protein